MQQRIDSLAQQVEHNTFNVGVLGSSPRRITQKKAIILKKVIAFFIFARMVPVLFLPFFPQTCHVFQGFTFCFRY